MSKLTKNQRLALEKIEAGKAYSLKEASALVKEITNSKFDASVDIDVRLGVDPRKANQMVRGVVSLPNGTGKEVRVLALCTPDQEAAAKEAGADYVGLDEYIDKIKGGWTDVDVIITMPAIMTEGYSTQTGELAIGRNLKVAFMGFITYNERYNQIIDTWTHVNSKLSNILMKQLSSDNQGFNSVYMMLDSGARGSKEQIRQLSGMRGLMAKPQKSGAEGGQIIENPILSNFKEGLSVLEYFISTHGARKGLADTALKTADAGYLTRRLVDVSHDVIINKDDCGTLRGLVATEMKNNEDVISSLYERILGRVSVHDIYHPLTGELIVASGEQITEPLAKIIQDSPIERVEIRSVLTCESRKGVCAKCYGRNLATGKMVHMSTNTT